MPQLIDLDWLEALPAVDVSGASDDARLDALARDLASLVCPSATLRVWPAEGWERLANRSRATDLTAAGQDELPDAYSFPDAICLEADLLRLLADLETEVRRARRGRWIAQVMALPA